MDPNARFLLKAFRKYYRVNTPILPDRFTRREFGFMFFDRTYVQRHMSFTRPEDLHRFMLGQVPSHSYYSTSYYRKPDAPTMDEKGWMGAELIFDLDADHLEGAATMTYAEMLLQIRSEMINLVDSFLLGDLGFSEDQVHITFSGGRGYHAHVRTPDVMGLGTHERRELVDYITGTGLNIDWVFPYNRVATSQVVTGTGVRTNVAKDRLIPPADSGGWKLRMRNGLMDVVNDICDTDVKAVKREYPSIKGSNAQTIAKAQEELRKSRGVLFQKNTMAVLSQSTQNILVKIHPRNRVNRFQEAGYATNQDTSMPWELIVLNSSFERTLFLTVGSSAATNPWCVFGIPAKAVFLCNLVEEPQKLRNDGLDQTKQICQGRPDLFFFPSSWEECEELIPRLLEEAGQTPGSSQETKKEESL